MKILTTVASVNASSYKRAGKRRVLVPTMGALHKAHRELIRVARERAGRDGEVAVSIFVNPLQFEPGTDYERYPRPEKADEEFCLLLGSPRSHLRKACLPALQNENRKFSLKHKIAPRSPPSN